MESERGGEGAQEREGAKTTIREGVRRRGRTRWRGEGARELEGAILREGECGVKERERRRKSRWEAERKEATGE